jgi:hypothetical protein
MKKQNIIIAIMMRGNIHQKPKPYPNHAHGNIWDHLLSYSRQTCGFQLQALSPPFGRFCVAFVSLVSASLPWPIILFIMEQQSMMSALPGQQLFIISAILWKSPQGKEKLAVRGFFSLFVFLVFTWITSFLTV